MRPHDIRSHWNAVGRKLATTSPRQRTLLMLLPVIIMAVLLRLPGLAGDPPGFRDEEAAVALAAQRIERSNLPIYFTQGSDALEPGFVYAASVTGRLAGWGVDGPRLAAGVLGTLAAVGCSLWYRRSLGLGWGLVGGLLVATSFWQVAFSRQALPAISMATIAAFGLWALQRATAERQTRRTGPLPSGWYGLAGVLLGLGIYTDVAMRAVLPVVLLIGALLFFRKGYLVPVADRRGLVLGGVVMLLVAAPLLSYFWQNPDTFRQGIDNLGADGSALERIRATLGAIAWSGESNPAYAFAGRPILDPALLVWAAIGLLVALKRPLDGVHGGALIWLAGFLAVVMAVAPGSHAQMLALTPVLFFFPIRGMQAVLTAARARGRMQSAVVLAAVVFSVAGSAAWSVVTYVQWTADGDTYRAFNGDVTDTLEALHDLPDDDITIYMATGENDRIVRYLAPERTRRDFDNPRLLPMPAAGPAYLAVPVSSGMSAALLTYMDDETLVASGSSAERGPAFNIWLVDERVRERLPYAAPAIRFESGPTLLGFEVGPLPGSLDAPAIDVVLVYRVAPGGQSFSAQVRLVELDGETVGPVETLVQPGPDYVVSKDEIILVRIDLPFPQSPDMVADLHTALQWQSGEYLLPYGPNVIVYDDVFALLNAIGYIGPAP